MVTEPANDLFAEQILLCTLIHYPEELPVAHEFIDGPECFWSPENGSLWAGINRLHAEGLPITPDSLKQIVGETATVLGDAFFRGMFADRWKIGNISAATIPHYAQTVREKHQVRNLSVVGREIARLAESKDALPVDIAARAADMLGQAVTQKQAGFVRIADAAHEVVEELCGGVPAYLPTPWPNFDTDMGGIAKGCVTTVLGAPSSGKTTWCLQLILSFAERGLPVTIFSNEQGPKRVAATFLSMKTGIQIHSLWGKGGTTNAQLAKITEAALEFEKLPLVQVPNSMNARQIYQHAKLAKQRGCKIILVDYLQQLPPLPHTNSDKERIAESMKEIARIRDLDMTVLLVSQIDKATGKGGVITGESKRRPSMFDGVGAGEIEQGSDWIISVFRPHMHELATGTVDDWEYKQSIAEVAVLKAKFGARGMCNFRFHPGTMQFTEA